MISVWFGSSPACCGGILLGARHRTRKQTTSERHPREPAFSHQRWASATLSSTPYSSHPFIPRPVLFQGAFFHAHLFKPATRHPEIPPVCWSVRKIYIFSLQLVICMWILVSDLHSLPLETHRTVLNQILRQSTTHLADGPFAVLVDYIRILDFDVKRK